MSWLFSQALVEEYLGDICLDGEQSAPLSGSNIQQAYCVPDKMTVFSRLSRFGMTYKPLTESRGEELLTLFREDFHARTLVPQEKVQELTENEAECGEKWRASFTKYDPDTSLWKTHQCSLLGDLDEFLETWPQWGLMRDGECWEQRTLEQTIRGTEYGLSEKLPTPCAGDHKSKPTSTSWKAKGAINYSLANPEIQAKWATPTTMDRLPPKSAQALLKEATFARPGRSKPANLRDQVSNMKNWPTPVKSDHAARRPSKGWQGNSDLPSVVWTETGGKQNPEMSPASLNATWVEWLMGWPLGWTDLKPLATDKCHSVQQQLGES